MALSATGLGLYLSTHPRSSLPLTALPCTHLIGKRCGSPFLQSDVYRLSIYLSTAQTLSGLRSSNSNVIGQWSEPITSRRISALATFRLYAGGTRK